MREKFSKPFSVDIDDIKLDIQNFRYYGELSSQRDCIDAMLSDPRSRIDQLSKDIIEIGGLTPNPIVLSKNEQDEWIVREGNRRITALKILNNPAIIRDKSLQKRFNAIVKKSNARIPNSIECISCDDEECILDFLDRSHTGYRNGTGRVDWNAENKGQFDMHRGKPAANALAIKVKELVTKDGTSLKEPYKITNLQRIMQNKDVQSMLNYSWDGKDITSSISPPILLQIFKEIAKEAGKTKVGKIYFKDDQTEFVERIINKFDIDINEVKTEPYVVGTKGKGTKKATTAKTTYYTKLPSWDRKRLIKPRGTYLRIPSRPENNKVNTIVSELSRKVDVREAPNAAAVLLRMLIEMTMSRYIKVHQLKVKDTLAGNIRGVANHLQREGKITNNYCNEIIRVGDNDTLMSAKTLQRFVHSFDFSPDYKILNTLWDNIERFIAICWR